MQAEDGSRGACVKVIDIVLFSGTLKLATFNTVDIDGRLDSNLLLSPQECAELGWVAAKATDLALRFRLGTRYGIPGPATGVLGGG